MCDRCGEAYAVLVAEAGEDHASWFLWEETPYPAGGPDDIVPKLIAEAGRVRMEAMLGSAAEGRS